MMQKFLVLIASLLFFFACAHGYKSENHTPRSPLELKITSQIEHLADEADGLAKQSPADLSPSVAPFADSAERFKNNSLRFGPGSLDARNALDKVRYNASQLDRVLTADKYPTLMTSWLKIKTDIDSIAKQLGYKVNDKGF